MARSYASIAVTGLRGIPNVMGGIESHCEELLPRIKQRRPQLRITVFARAPYVGGERRSFGGIDVVPVASGKRQSTEALLGTFFGVLAAAFSRARLIHIHAIGPGLMAPLARLFGFRVVVTHHGADYDRAKWGRVARFVLRAGEWAAVHFAHKVIAVSPSLAEAMKAAYPRQAAKIRFIPNGAPRIEVGDEPPEAVLSKLGISPQAFMLAVGRLVPEKGFDYLIEAFHRCRCGRKLLIAGGADHVTPFVEFLQRQADDEVVLIGNQPRSVLRVLYQHTGRFILPSYHEGLAISALEAGILSAPSMLSDIAANRDLGYDQDHYFPVGNVGALAAKLSEPDAMFKVDAAKLQTQFDWDRIARQTLELYDETLTEPAPAAVRAGA